MLLGKRDNEKITGLRNITKYIIIPKSSAQYRGRYEAKIQRIENGCYFWYRIQLTIIQITHGKYRENWKETKTKLTYKLNGLINKKIEGKASVFKKFWIK